MPNTTILHLSDFHWSAEKQNDQRIIVDALIADLAKLQRDRSLSPDLIFFTGDLVQSGDNWEEFQSAQTELIDRVLLATGLQKDRLFITPGNHDIRRRVVRSDSFVDVGLTQTLLGVDEVNRFIDGLSSESASNQVALARMEHFDRYVVGGGGATPIRSSPLLRTFSLSLPGASVGVACFNTAWRATGEGDAVDRNRLLLGERNVDNAVQDLNGADIRLALFHHPLEWLAEFDESAVTSRLYAEFDALFYGHAHRTRPELRVTGNGRAVLCQTGCLYEKRGYPNGYQFVILDPDVEELTVVARTYFNDRRTFDVAVDVVENGTATFDFKPTITKPAFPEVERFLREARPAIRRAASEQMKIADRDGDPALDVKEAFECPPITLFRSETKEGTLEVDRSKQLNGEDLLRAEANFLVVGERECGKSSLAHYMAVLCAEGVVDRPRIPVVIDYRKVTPKNLYSLKRAIGAYFGATRVGLDADALVERGDFLFLVDNYSGQDSSAKAQFQALLSQIGSCRVICFADALVGGLAIQSDPADALGGFQTAHIQALPRRAIRALSSRWCEQTGLDRDQAYAAVMTHIRRSNLPKTGYIVTLLLWAVFQERNFERVNEAVLLNNIADYLLEKADFSQAVRGTFDAVSKEITLREIAHFLRGKSGVATALEVETFLNSFLSVRGLTYDPGRILDSLVGCGILVREDGSISFKYRAFQDYFCAVYLRAEPDELRRILNTFEFVEYSREIDLLTGLIRDAAEILVTLTSHVVLSAPIEIAEMQLEIFDQMAVTESALGISDRQLLDIRRKKLTSEQIDDLLDEADKRVAGTPQKAQASAGINSRSSENTERDAKSTANVTALMDIPTFVAANDLLGRAVRNSEFVDAELKLKAMEAYFRNVARIYLSYTRAVNEIMALFDRPDVAEKIPTSEEVRRVLRYVLNQALFLFIGGEAAEGIGSSNLAQIYERALDGTNLEGLEKLLIVLVCLDLGVGNWDQRVLDLVAEYKGKRFVLDAVVQRIWLLTRSKPLSSPEEARITKVVDGIERALGRPKGSKSGTVERISTAVEKTRKEEAPSAKPKGAR
ncbi:metallophosphoesterase [Phenylobacterium sp.]|uniref:metallophosphoesterase n=1 Tax=Phenylobacterium sp. TaxID=1871053 RepID=UPI002DE3EB1A|nr:metallophosphoesterase [Phenylobacterium sp.]